MSSDEFWDSDLKTVAGIIEERANIQTLSFRGEWERARWLAAAMLQPHLKKGANIKATDIVQFDWEKKAAPRSNTSRKEMFDKWDAQMKEKHGKNKH